VLGSLLSGLIEAGLKTGLIASGLRPVEERVWGVIRLFVRRRQPLDHRLQHGHDCLFVTQQPRPAARAAAAEGATAGTAAADAAAAGVAASYYCCRRCYWLLALARACV